MTLSLRDVYNGTTVLVTGHTGFKGSWLSIWLKELGANVVGYSLDPPTSPNLFETAGLGGRMPSIHGDVRDLSALEAVVAAYEPRVVFHLAAQALVRRSYREPVSTYETNVLGTVHLLEACRRSASVSSIVVVTSDKCYDNDGQDHAFRETDSLGGRDPYSSSKGCAELVTQAYAKSFFAEEPGSTVHKSLASVRAGNVIGGGDWAEDRLVPDCVRALAAHQPIVLRNPDAVRPWQHVLEPLHGYLLLAARMEETPGAFSGPWNFGPDSGDFLSVSDVAEELVRAWGEGTVRVCRDQSAPEARILRLDSTKARKRLDWRPRQDLRTSLTQTVLWYKRFLTGADVLPLCREQIALYEEWMQPAHVR
jgi:CDP-glucose 4,6-dehydratase